ncbi:transglycosylase SLT domain-containing protein [Acetobacter tropicalis]|uniref:transglycosylase SLT domain-containing protein n=1 Tax=Acetobacter tropicalis TaxID=104102 RepID=UPI003976FABE
MTSRPSFCSGAFLARHSGRMLRRVLSTSPALGLLALLAACAGQPRPGDAPSMPVAEEAAQYRAHARSYYAPPGPPEDPWGPYIQEAAKRFDVPEAWVRAVMQQESGGRLFHNGQFVTSVPGAMGLMQLMPPTYDEMRYAYNLGDDPYEPHDNIMAGTAYLRQMYDIYGSPGFLAAYNAGPGRLEDFLTRNRTLPRETRNYVASIGRKIVGISPSNRSQADILVASHDSMALAYQPVQTNPETSAVRTAWARRQGGSAASTQPLQVAEAASDGNPPVTPSYGADWHPVGHSGSSIAAATARNDVSAAWAKRLGAGAAATESEPVQVAQAVDSSEPVDNPIADPEQEEAAPAHVVRVAASTPAPSAQQSSHNFHLVTPAMAEPAPLLTRKARTAAARDWAIQVGAFGSASMAQQATGQARTRANASLSGAKAQVAAVQVNKSRLYRARLTNLSHEDAVAACRRLSGCVVVSPSSRS